MDMDKRDLAMETFIKESFKIIVLTGLALIIGSKIQRLIKEALKMV